MTAGSHDTVALIAAAGEGMRLGRGPKAFLQLGRQSLLHRVTQVVRPCVNRVLVAVSEDLLDRASQELGALATVMTGGLTRFDTVWKLVRASDEPIVLIHDPVRPFADQDLIERVRDTARELGAAAACLACPLMPARVDGTGGLTEAVTRPGVTLVNSPVAFERGLLERALRQAEKNGLDDPNPVHCVLAMGHRVRAVECDPTNIKITHPFDWEMAQKVVNPSLGPGSAGPMKKGSREHPSSEGIRR